MVVCEAAPVVLVCEADPVVLVTIDGSRWQDVSDPDVMPTLHALGTEQGAWVSDIRASGPNFVSLPGYTEIFTGAPPADCRDNECAQTRRLTFLDAATESGLSVSAFASWEKIPRAMTSRPGSFPVSAGQDGAYRWDQATASIALDAFERERPDVFYLGLGDPDEHAHRGNRAGYTESLRSADAVLARLMEILAAMGERGRATHVFVTADHGRAENFRDHGGFAPESARVWLVAAGRRIRARGFVTSPHERRLADVAPTIERVIGLTPSGEILGELGVD